MPALALYQPDIALNVGAAIRLCRNLGLHLHIIEPCGFLWDEKRIRQSALDYYRAEDITRWLDWEQFFNAQQGKSRIILLSTKAATPYINLAFQPGDILMAGRESAGVPETVHAAVDARVLVPMVPDGRSLNVMTALTMVTGEALRHTGFNG